jgi:O-antigen/teichoic acid export membrane protein
VYVKKFVVILLIIGLASMLCASSISASKVRTLAEEHARQDVRKLGTLFLGVLFPVLTPVVSFVRNYSVPNERLIYIESLVNEPELI